MATNNDILAAIHELTGAVNALVQAQTVAAAPAKPADKANTRARKAPQPKADGKVYRSAKGKEQAKAQCERVWAEAKAKAGVQRVRDLTPKQRKAVDAEIRAIWAAVPKTRSTKA